MNPLIPNTVIDMTGPAEKVKAKGGYLDPRFQAVVTMQDKTTRVITAMVLRSEAILTHDLYEEEPHHREDCRACRLLNELEVADGQG